MRPRRSPPIVTLGTFLVVACAADTPTAPAVPADGPPQPPIASASAVASVRIAVLDATTRLVPALGGGDAARAVETALSRLTAALSAHDTRALADRLEDAAAALAAAEAAADPVGPAVPELSAIRLALDAARAALGAARRGEW